MILVGALSGDPFIHDGEDFEGWSSPSWSWSVSLEATITDVNPAFARLMLGSDKRIPAFWPRMKYRARRRHLGYTRTGNLR